MIIKELTIKNFRSYYGECKFDFSDGLTLIIGDNGDGKSSFFDALRWLFDTSKENLSIDNVSEMCKSEMEVGDKNSVSVSIIFEHDGEKNVEKSFIVERTDSNYKTSGFEFIGYETYNNERRKVNGKNLMDRCFDAFIQNFSMFKGESTLNVFDNPTSLKALVDKFSDVRKFDDLVDITSKMEEKSNKQYINAASRDKKIEKESKELQKNIEELRSKISEKNSKINEKKKAIATYSTTLDKLAENKDIAEQYKAIMGRLEDQEQELNRNRGRLGSVNLNTSLFNQMWILCLFSNILKEFSEKSSKISKEKRKQEKEFIEANAKALGRLEAQKEVLGTLINGTTELPWYLPDQETMEEMIKDEVCKVCGRAVHKGDPAYDFMVNRLNEYKRRVEQNLRKEPENGEGGQEQLFVNSYIEEIHHLSFALGGINEQMVSKISDEIKERLKLNARLSEAIHELEESIENTNEDKARLLIQGNVEEAVLEKDFMDIKGLFEKKGLESNRLIELQKEKETLENALAENISKHEQLMPENGMINVYRKINQTLKAIATAFENAKDANERQFLQNLEDQANKYVKRLSANDFHGIVHLIKTADGNVSIKLFSSNDDEIKNPSGSQETIKYISILFAISDFTRQARKEDYPLIFDAATSSFGEEKEQDFYNVVNDLKKQCIIVTKDFISNGELRHDDIDKLSCSVYRIKKGANFDQSDLSTIRTIINKIK